MDRQTTKLTRKFEEDSFVWSLHRFIVTLRTAERAGVQVSEMLELIATIESDAKAVRDMREHLNEYEALGGRRQEEFVRTRSFEDFGPIEANAAWQVVVGKEFLLGNRLDFWAAERTLHATLGIICRRIDFLNAIPELRVFASKVDWNAFDEIQIIDEVRV